MTPCLEFRINQLIIYADLELAAGGRDKADALDLWLEILQQIGNQAHGPVSVMSNCAIFDPYFHLSIAPVVKIILLLGFRRESTERFIDNFIIFSQ